MDWRDIFIVRVISIFIAIGILFPLAIALKHTNPFPFWSSISAGIAILVIGFFGKMWLRRQF